MQSSRFAVQRRYASWLRPLSATLVVIPGIAYSSSKVTVRMSACDDCTTCRASRRFIASRWCGLVAHTDSKTSRTCSRVSALTVSERSARAGGCSEGGGRCSRALPFGGLPFTRPNECA